MRQSNRLIKELEEELESIYSLLKKNEEKQKENAEALKNNQELELEIKQIVAELNDVLKRKGSPPIIDEKKRAGFGSNSLYNVSNVERSHVNDNSIYAKSRSVKKDDKPRGSLRNVVA